MTSVTPSETTACRLEDFNPRSGSRLERAVFNHRVLVLLLCVLVTILLGFSALSLKLNASFEKTIPTNHPYIANYLAHKKELTGLGNSLRIAVEARKGDIYTASYIDTLRQINDAVFMLPGVDRAFMKSLWTPNVRWTAVTEDGLDGGQVIPAHYDGSPAKIEELRMNVQRSGEIGQLVAANGGSSVLQVPLLEHDASGKPLDYAALSDRLEQIRAKYSSDEVAIHITGFAKLSGDLMDGMQEVIGFFFIALAICAAMVFLYNRDLISTALVVITSVTGVLWQLGLLPLLGYSLNPYSMLVPFLIFAIGISHGAQKMNGILQDIGRGMHRYVAARYTFRRLFLAGLTALLADAVGFAVLLMIDIPVIRELAIAASLGVLVLVISNLILLPVLLSYVGVSRKAAERAVQRESVSAAGHSGAFFVWLVRFTEGRRAALAIATAAVLAVLGVAVGTQLKVGDLDPGAPELQADSRYNRDVNYLTKNYGASNDLFAIMVKTPDGRCSQYDVLRRVDQLEWELMDLPGVESTQSIARLQRRLMVGMNEGSPLWYDLPSNQSMLNTITARAPRELYNEECNLLTVYAYLRDHRAETLQQVVDLVERFARKNNDQDATFLLAAGSAGIDATTNIVVHKAWYQMLFMVYGAVALLCFITFRSWRAVLVAMLPLMLTSVLAEALMVLLGMGVKVATLPVIALGVGIGVDYALYVLSVTLARMRAGATLKQAYATALQFTGRVVLLTGVTLAAAVATWHFSSIKFQADMGLLLAFMFLWNMLGALVLIPALARYLLPGAHEGSTVAASDAAAHTSAAASITPSQTNKLVYERCLP
ncbi:RND family transporter [Pseudomonas citronellolis]|uniref:efflux RND transporter permease subunit n=1 Tax=Pseudomonas citronellolis TaxID=53408 RepID=UPI0022703CA3|nr:MMPL family transporter [Pseudomonas citronellolis]WAB91914.1 MMPL family transporter [Pseudomonas citronellolis]